MDVRGTLLIPRSIPAAQLREQLRRQDLDVEGFVDHGVGLDAHGAGAKGERLLALVGVLHRVGDCHHERGLGVAAQRFLSEGS